MAEKWEPDPLTKLYEEVEQLKNKAKTFVTQDQFFPVRAIVFGLVGLILTGVVVALLTLIIREPQRGGIETHVESVIPQKK